MKEKTKNLLNFLGRFGLSGLLLWYLFSKIDVQKTVEVLKTAELKYIFYAGMVFMSIHILLLVRWLVFIRALGLTTKVIDVVRYFFIGLFGNLFLPSAIGGDIIKIVALCKNNDQKPRVVASVLLDRLSGFAAIAIVALCSFVLGYKLINDVTLVVPIVFISGGILSIGAILFNEKIYSFGCRIFNRIPKVKNALMQMHYDIALLKGQKKVGFKTVGIACVCQFLLAIVFFLLAKALHQDVSFLVCLIFVPMICVASSFPSIGGLGVREAAAAYLFAKVGVDSGISVSMALMNGFFMVIIGLLGGLIYVSTISRRRVQCCVSDEGGAASNPRATASSASAVN